MKSFHEARNAKIPTVADIGASSGKISRTNTRQVLAPSTRIDSSSEIGSDRRNAGNSRGGNERANTMGRIATPVGVSRPTVPVRVTCGRATTEHGGHNGPRREAKDQ